MSADAAHVDAGREKRIERLGYDLDRRELEPVAACNLCGSTHHVEVSRRDRYGYPAILRICARCGLGFLSPRLPAAEYAAFYAEDLPAARQRVPRPADRRRDRAGRAARVRRRARSSSSVEACPVRRRASSTWVARPGSWPVRCGTRSEPRPPSSTPRRTSSPSRQPPGWRPSRLRRGLRSGRAALRARPSLPDDRPPSRCRRHAGGAAAADRRPTVAPSSTSSTSSSWRAAAGRSRPPRRSTTRTT